MCNVSSFDNGGENQETNFLTKVGNINIAQKAEFKTQKVA